MKHGKKVLALVIALVAILGTTVTALAATGQIGVNKVGNQYAVDYITNEYYDDGVLVQIIERKWVPENRYDANNPRRPIPSNSTSPQPSPNTNGDRVQTLRNAGINSRNDLQTYAWSYQWSTTPVETYASNDRLETNITFQVDASASADRWKCTFKQVVTYSGNNTVVKYYIDNQEYSVDAIKRMFKQYGKAR